MEKEKLTNGIAGSVLVVEDDLELSAVIDRILKSINPGLHLDWATTAEEALDILLQRSRDFSQEQNPYDLMIADIFLEGTHTGLDLFKYCHSEFPTMKVVIISGMNLESLLGLLDHESPAFPYLQKPFTVGECRQLLQTWIRA